VEENPLASMISPKTWSRMSDESAGPCTNGAPINGLQKCEWLGKGEGVGEVGIRECGVCEICENA
jgi:hypothetical protein